MGFPIRQLFSVGILQDDGFTITNLYGDGVVRLAKELPNGDTLYTFVREDGSYRPPRVWEVTIERLVEEAETLEFSN